jgi:ATP-binding cassette subfamily G (WHITE) protein 2 (SNQ2)
VIFQSPGKEATTVKHVPHTFVFRNVSLTVSTPSGQQKLLDSLEGIVRGGRLTALMGSSGAGKTTLLNTLAQRSIGGATISGAIYLNGQPLLKSFRRKVGYAEQMDLHEETATVLEAVRFSALLRQPATTTTTEKYAHCDEVLDMLELRDVSNAVIGVPGKGLNSETRKLVTIAVELAAKPDTLLFLDEPTSGLDSAAAFNVVRALKKLADSGLAILCTIHQPSSNLLGLFDDLYLLAPGGRCVYNGALGSEGRRMIDYFEQSGAAPCVSGDNPGKLSVFPARSQCFAYFVAQPNGCSPRLALVIPAIQVLIGQSSGSCPWNTRSWQIRWRKRWNAYRLQLAHNAAQCLMIRATTLRLL